MTLPFSTKWPKSMGDLAGHPNYFIQKIWMKLPVVNRQELRETHFEVHRDEFAETWDITGKAINPKLHTIRQDPGNRWKEGMKIHFVINNRTKNRFQFAPVIKCISVQEIEFYWWKPENSKRYPSPFDDKQNGRYCNVYIGNRVLMNDEVKSLAINDGFDSVEDFFAYFNKDFKGKIIHWTDLKY